MFNDQRSSLSQQRFDACQAYQILCRDVPNFTWSDWKSPLKSTVFLHGYFTNEDQDCEPATIIHIDTANDIDSLTNRFVMRGLLPFDYVHTTNTYYVQVVATTSGEENTFSMSASQVKMVCIPDFSTRKIVLMHTQMERTTGDTDKNRGSIYVLVRVFNVGHEGMGMQIMVDPQKKRQNAELLVEPSRYNITLPLPGQRRILPSFQKSLVEELQSPLKLSLLQKLSQRSSTTISHPPLSTQPPPGSQPEADPAPRKPRSNSVTSTNSCPEPRWIEANIPSTKQFDPKSDQSQHNPINGGVSAVQRFTA